MLQGNPEPCEQFSETIVREKTDKIIKKQEPDCLETKQRLSNFIFLCIYSIINSSIIV